MSADRNLENNDTKNMDLIIFFQIVQNRFDNFPKVVIVSIY